jgi:hypothetical protein
MDAVSTEEGTYEKMAGKLPEFSGIFKFFLWGMPRLISLVFLIVLLVWIVEVEVYIYTLYVY